MHDESSNNTQFLKDLIFSQNKEVVAKNEFLSNSVYRYSADSKKIEIAE